MVFKFNPGDTLPLIGRLIRDQGRRHTGMYLVAIACMATIAATTSLAAWLMRDVINQVFVDRDETAVLWLAGVIIVIYSVKGIATYGQQVTLSRIANGIVASVQRDLYAHLLRMNVRYFLDRHTSEFVARQSFMASSCGGVLNTIVTSLGRDLLSLLGLLAVMVLQDPMMSIVGLVFMPAAVVGVQKLVKRARKIMHTGFAQSMVVMEITQETTHGVKVVKSLGLERLLSGRMERAIAEVERASNKLASVGARSAPLMETLGGFAVAGVIFYGGTRVISEGQTPGAFFSFITALLLAYEPAKRLARVHIDLGTSLVGVKLLYDFLDTPASEPDEPDLPDATVAAGRIVFDDVRFSYRDGEDVLTGLTLVAEAGKTTALVGRSGGGKSTTFALLLRFYDPHSGSITIDGADIAGLKRRSVRRLISYVGQEVFLFKGSIYDNIAFGREGASRTEVEAAARAANAHDFILTFAEGYGTQIGENGSQLSGGQRQRLAIARAVLQNAPILLLDEATAALDSESERAIQEALTALARNRTTLVIAHRLQTVQGADKICVVENGRIAEEGTHETLLALGGRYTMLHNANLARDD